MVTSRISTEPKPWRLKEAHCDRTWRRLRSVHSSLSNTPCRRVPAITSNVTQCVQGSHGTQVLRLASTLSPSCSLSAGQTVRATSDFGFAQLRQQRYPQWIICTGSSRIHLQTQHRNFSRSLTLSSRLFFASYTFTVSSAINKTLRYFPELHHSYIMRNVNDVREYIHGALQN